MSPVAWRALAAQLGLAPEKVSGPLYVVDRLGRVVYCNQPLADLIGGRVADIVGKPSVIFYPPEAVPVFLMRRVAALSGRPPTATLATHLRASGGRAIPVELSVTSLVSGGRVIGRVSVVRPSPEPGVSRPVIEQPSVETLLQLSPDEADALPYGVILLDPDGMIVGYNAAESRLSGLARREVLGRNFFRDVAPCTRVRAFGGQYRRMVETGDSRQISFDFVFRFSYGEKRVAVTLGYSPDTRQGAVVVEQR